MNSTENLITNPLWQASDLGKPLADSVHAVSVAMPLWEHVVAYEEGKQDVVSKLQTGYPRFLIHPFISRLAEETALRFKKSNPCFLFPSKAVSQRATEFVLKEFPSAILEIEEIEQGVCALFFPVECFDRVKAYWQHTGEIITSRCAASLLEHGSVNRIAGAEAKQKISKKISKLLSCNKNDVYILPSGMAAIFLAYRALEKIRSVGSHLQFGFPYVDTLKILDKFSTNHHFFPKGDAVDLAKLESQAKLEQPKAIFCEFPSNPLLHSLDLQRLKSIGAPLVVDDTIGSFYNLNLLKDVDILVSSLTKFFSGNGNCMGGSLVLNQSSQFYPELSYAIGELYEDLCWPEDLLVLSANSENYEVRMEKINHNTEVLCDFLKSRVEVESIYYPKFGSCEHYEHYRNSTAGYSGLFSIVLKGGEEKAKRFYDALRVCKGPNLGTDYTLACPYVLLAHFNELEWAASCGIPAHLIRVSVGLEKIEDLIERFEQALSF